MIPLLATLCAILASSMLIRVDRGSGRTSKALLIPLAWLIIAFSRPLSNWISFGAPMGEAGGYTEGSPIDRNFFTLLLIFAIFILQQRSNQVMAIWRSNPALVAFFAYCLISIFWAEFPLVLFKRWIRAVGDVAVICIIITDASPVDALTRVFMWLGSTLLPLSILFTRFFPALGRSYKMSGEPMWTGVATDKNALGALCMLVGLFLLARGLSVWRNEKGKQRNRRFSVIGILLAISCYLLLLIDSKTALACFLMASILVILPEFSVLSRPWLITFIIAAMIFTIYGILFMGLGSSAIAEMGRDTSLTGRTEVWAIVLPFAVNPWVGAGFENFWVGSRFLEVGLAVGSPGMNQAHNGYIETYLNLGWIGLLLLAAFIFCGYRNILAGIKTDREWSGLKLAFFFICLVYNFTEASFKFMSPVWLLFLWATFQIPRRRKVRPAEFSELPARRELVSSAWPIT